MMSTCAFAQDLVSKLASTLGVHIVTSYTPTGAAVSCVVWAVRCESWLCEESQGSFVAPVPLTMLFVCARLAPSSASLCCNNSDAPCVSHAAICTPHGVWPHCQVASGHAGVQVDCEL